MSSFFEKLTGASPDEIDEIKEETKPVKKVKKNLTKKVEKKVKKMPPIAEPEIEGDVKKESLAMPKPKKIINKDLREDSEKSITPEVEDKEKGWLEEVEGEEGQLTIDVYQTETDILIKSTIAGVNPEDIDISITNDMVTVRGKRTKDEKITAENYYYQELYWGAFSRSVILPIEVDSDRAKATIKNGILTIRLPKSEKVKTKRIAVRPEES